MQPLSHKIFITRLAAAVLCGLLMASCQPGQQQAPPPGPDAASGRGDGAAATGSADDGIAGSHIGLSHGGNQTPGQRACPQKRLFTEGADVQAGDLLYQIDPAPFQAAPEECQGRPGPIRSQSAGDSVQDRPLQGTAGRQGGQPAGIRRRGLGTDQTEADIAVWEATVETARINLAYTRITAPISGRIGRSNATEGAIVTAYQPHGPGHHPAVGSHLCRRAPVHHGTAAA